MNRDEVRRRFVLPIVVVVGGLLLARSGTWEVEAHKAVTSPYTYNEHVFPILRDKCGSCHIDGGPAPMSLLVYRGQDGTGGAFSWAESIREMLVSGAMPPWYADPRGPAVRHPHGLSARELDTVVTWAAGGAPEGDPAKKPTAPPLRTGWPLGKPDLVLSMSSAHEVAANVLEETVDVTMPTQLTTSRWVKAADLLPGTVAMVRRAEISIDQGPLLSVWEPGDDVTMAPSGTAFRLAAATNVHLRLFYKKPWQEQNRSSSDRSSVGLYFADPPRSGNGIKAFAIDGEQTNAAPLTTLKGEMPSGGRVLAIRPQLDRPYENMEITAVTAAGRRVPLLKLHAARPEWPRRYWLADPVELPGGATIEVTGTAGDPDRGPLTKLEPMPLRIAFDVSFE